MCGLLGGNQPEWSYDAAVERLFNRGPDSNSVESAGQFTLGFARLAVIDPSNAGCQPMSSCDGRIQLCFNGAIYGHELVRKELQQRGHTFRSRSDTEVILNAYLEWGHDFVDHIDGMFAIAIHDQRIEKLFLFRDRPGIKPLYYFRRGPDFAFASELHSLRVLLKDTPLQHDATAQYDFLTYGYVPAPKTLFSDVFKLPPASRLTFDVARQRMEDVSPYWQLPTNADAAFDIHTAAEQTRELIQDSVEQQMTADVPVGCFLSGGIDSSIVVSHAAQATTRLRTFSAGFDDEQHSETHFARLVATQFRTDHREIIWRSMSPEQQLNTLQTLYAEPFADTSA